MPRVTILALLAIVLLDTAAPAAVPKAPRKPPEPARRLVEAGLVAMGGEQAIRAIQSVRFDATSERRALEQSERPEGPYVIESAHVSEWRDVAAGQWKQTSDTQFAWMKSSSTTIVAGGVAVREADGRSVRGSGQDLVDAEEALELDPDRVLITAIDGPDLRRLPDVSLHSVPHHVIAFTWRQHPVKIFLNADTHLPTAVEWTRGYPFHMFWSVWGDVTTRVYYSMWWLASGGVRYPLQSDVVRNGLPDRTTTITALAIENARAPDVFEIDQAAGKAFRSSKPRSLDETKLPVATARELAPGVVFIRGSWNTTIVKQDDGVVILEAPISSGYSAQVIAEAKRRYPGAPINAVVSTSDSWPHIGGVREYVAAGIPVYVLDRTRPLLARVIAAPRTTFPDTLAKTPTPAHLMPVAEKTIVGAGTNRIEIYPTRGQTTERQMIVYLPEHRLLYGSDAFQRMPDGEFFYPQTITELRDAVAREHLAVDTYFMMHLPPSPWRELLDIAGGPLPK